MERDEDRDRVVKRQRDEEKGIHPHRDLRDSVKDAGGEKMKQRERLRLRREDSGGGTPWGRRRG